MSAVCMEAAEALQACRHEVLLLLEELGDLALTLREAHDYATQANREMMRASAEDAVEAANDAMNRLRTIALKGEEVLS